MNTARREQCEWPPPKQKKMQVNSERPARYSTANNPRQRHGMHADPHRTTRANNGERACLHQLVVGVAQYVSNDNHRGISTHLPPSVTTYRPKWPEPKNCRKKVLQLQRHSDDLNSTLRKSTETQWNSHKSKHKSKPRLPDNNKKVWNNEQAQQFANWKIFYPCSW